MYPLFAAPFVWLFGTNGFLVLHAILLALVAWCGYLFLHARMNATLAAALAGAFVMASIVPVYFVWITPELFNFALGFLAYFCWLYKEVESPDRAPRGTRWLFGGAGDLAAALILGIATFSKISNALRQQSGSRRGRDHHPTTHTHNNKQQQRRPSSKQRRRRRAAAATTAAAAAAAAPAAADRQPSSQRSSGAHAAAAAAAGGHDGGGGGGGGDRRRPEQQAAAAAAALTKQQQQQQRRGAHDDHEQ